MKNFAIYIIKTILQLKYRQFSFQISMKMMRHYNNNSKHIY